MARVTAENLISRLKEIVGENPPDAYLGVLEDITDSVSDVNMDEYVNRSELEAMTQERDEAIASRDDMRSRYINRFYSNYDETNNKGYIMGEVSQGAIEEEEKTITYDDLFE